MLKAKSKTNKKPCAGGCGIKIPKHGEPTCGQAECVEAFIKSDAIEKAAKKARSQRLKREREQRKKDRKADREKLESLKSINKLLAECQTAVNSYIRERDKDRVCASCGCALQKGRVDAGHYIPRGKDGCSTSVRFAMGNIFSQCVTCNRFGFASHDYKRNIELRYGKGVLEPLERYYDEMKRQGFKPDREWIAIIKKNAQEQKKLLKN